MASEGEPEGHRLRLDGAQLVVLETLMPVRNPNLRPALLALGVSAMALGLAACKVDSRPLLARDGGGYAGAQAPG